MIACISDFKLVIIFPIAKGWKFFRCNSFWWNGWICQAICWIKARRNEALEIKAFNCPSPIRKFPRWPWRSTLNMKTLASINRMIKGPIQGSTVTEIWLWTISTWNNIKYPIWKGVWKQSWIVLCYFEIIYIFFTFFRARKVIRRS